MNNLPPLIDTHAHLDDDRFSSDLTEVLERAVASGIQRILTIGIDLSTSRSAIELALKHPLLSAVVGIQPNHVSEANPNDWDEIVALSKHSTVVAIGETGLDRYWDRAPFDLQEDYFVRHLALCRSCKLPVVIHCREAEADIVRMLRPEFDQHGPIRGVMHSFTGDIQTASACLEMGLHISFAGMVTFKNNLTLKEVAKTIPLDRILVETDSPYLAPMPHRGRRNEPAYVRHTAEFLAEVFRMTFEQFALQTTENAKNLFGS